MTAVARASQAEPSPSAGYQATDSHLAAAQWTSSTVDSSH